MECNHFLSILGEQILVFYNKSHVIHFAKNMAVMRDGENTIQVQYITANDRVKPATGVQGFSDLDAWL